MEGPNGLNDPLIFATWSLVFATSALVLGTFLYAIYTRRLVAEARSQGNALKEVAQSARELDNASTAFLLGIRSISDTLIMPRIVLRQSFREEREKFTPEFRGSKGLRIENVGVGPAIKGTLYKEEKEQWILVGEFLRIPQGWPYFYPSKDQPSLKILPEENRVRFRVAYYDLKDKDYEVIETVDFTVNI